MSRKPVYSIPADTPGTQTIHFYPDPAKKEEEGLPKKVRSYAGYADVDGPGPAKSHLFYWFFESQTCDPNIDAQAQQQLVDDTPLLIWLNGGPGASSLVGLFLENGPLRIGTDATGTVTVSPDTWNQEAHVVFWDQPVGSGYSYCETPDTYVEDEETVGLMFWRALQQFYATYPEYKKCPLYVCGESYAGKYVPAIARTIHRKNHEQAGTPLPLAGIAVGNGWIKPELSVRFLIDYAYASGLLGLNQKAVLDDSYAAFKTVLEEGEKEHDTKKLKQATDLGNGIVNAVVAYGGNFDLYDVRSWNDLDWGALPAYLNSQGVKDALHVTSEWLCADNSGPVAEALKADNMADASPWYTELIQAKEQYKVLLYTGDFDTACGYQSTEEILDAIVEPHDAWRKAERLIWKQAQGDPKGFVRTLGNVTQVALPGSGHEVPAYQPQICREMLYNWLSGRPFRGQDPERVAQEILAKAQEDARKEKEKG
ncbi:hypothetical protein ACFQ6N_01435 [Kitasatospora sp. NPDC056446]|uniref:S10 family serine carboxypeptidase-like protein n=1 Tax=Kitasatospora sp. NPDC056446 TaxID=3345819 RepID=UPI0036C41A71